MRQQRIVNNKPKAKPTIVNEKQMAALAKEQPVGSDLPVRTIYYVDIKDMDATRYGMLLEEVNRGASKLKGGVHYIIPVRNGKLGTDIEFEAEFLKTVNNLCEVKDGQIVLKNGAQEVRVIREQI